MSFGFKKFIRHTFNGAANRELVHAVQTNDLARVKKAFASGASPDAMSSKWKTSNWFNDGGIGGWLKTPVLMTAIAKGASTEIVREILSHDPDLGLRQTYRGRSFGGDGTILQMAERHEKHGGFKSRDDKVKAVLAYHRAKIGS